MRKIIIGRIDNGINLLLGDVSFNNLETVRAIDSKSEVFAINSYHVFLVLAALGSRFMCQL